MAEDDIKIFDAKLAGMVMASDFLLQKYKKKSNNGKTRGSPYEALIFGKILRLSQGYYGYCSMSKERMAWELGCSYELILQGYKNLEKDGYIRKVAHAKNDPNVNTSAYVSDIQKLYKDVQEKEEKDKAEGVGYDNDPNRKIRPRFVRKNQDVVV